MANIDTFKHGQKYKITNNLTTKHNLPIGKQFVANKSKIIDLIPSMYRHEESNLDNGVEKISASVIFITEVEKV